MADDDIGWGAVASGLVQEELRPNQGPLAPKRARGRPKKVTVVPAVAAPAPCEDVTQAAVLESSRSGNSVVQNLATRFRDAFTSVGSFFQVRLWETLSKYSAKAAPELPSANDSCSIASQNQANPASSLVDSVPILNLSTQQRIFDQGSRQSVSRDEKRVAACALQFSGLLTGAMLARCASFASQPNSAWKCLAIIKRRRYDETPTRITVREEPFRFEQLGKSQATAEVAKVFQTQFCCGMLLYNAATADSCLVKMALPSIMACVDSASAENIVRVQSEAESIVPSLQSLAQNTDVVFNIPVTDRASANIRAERELNATTPNGASTHFHCRVHKASQVQTKQFSHAELHVSGLLHVALSQRGGGARRALRNILHDIIKDRLNIYIGEAPDQYRAHREAVLNLNLGRNLQCLSHQI